LGALESIGYSPFFAGQHERLGRPELVPARIAAEGRGNYRLLGCRASIGELRGRLLHEADSGERPVVGDWVLVADDDDRAVIHHVMERRTAMSRRAAGSKTDIQVLAANVDLFFIVTSANRDFNIRRLERYLAAVLDSGARPAVVLNKIDVGEDVDGMFEEIESIGVGIPILKVSALTGDGLDELRGLIEAGMTFAFIGSSGVGKSSLINRLLGKEIQSVRDIRKDGKGRHATTRRELIEVPEGGVLIDTPGMREMGLIEDEGGVDEVFNDIAALAEKCRFRDCKHQGEPGCAVTAAVETGELDERRLASYHKLQREIAAARRRRDPVHAGRSKRRWKPVSKAIREYYKIVPKKKR
jgi:ribosome biogenesis GTPase